MVVHGLAVNLPWLAFVNASFALMVLLRNSLFGHIDALLHISPPLRQMIDASMLGVVILSVALVIMAAPHPRRQRRFVYVQSAVVDKLLLVYQRVTSSASRPIFVTLLMAGMTALYFHPVALLCFTVPLWISLPVASMLLNQEINYRFAGLWVVFTVILVCGRYILLSWFEEAWRRNQQNQRLISRLDALAHQDPLTKTANRRAMELVLENAVEQGKRFAVLMLDVDYFKLYNDTYGHRQETRVSRGWQRC